MFISHGTPCPECEFCCNKILYHGYTEGLPDLMECLRCGHEWMYKGVT